jgi:hypothetical protein
MTYVLLVLHIFGKRPFCSLCLFQLQVKWSDTTVHVWEMELLSNVLQVKDNGKELDKEIMKLKPAMYKGLDYQTAFSCFQEYRERNFNYSKINQATLVKTMCLGNHSEKQEWRISVDHNRLR